jgi:hypothetical protein
MRRAASAVAAQPSTSETAAEPRRARRVRASGSCTTGASLCRGCASECSLMHTAHRWRPRPAVPVADPAVPAVAAGDAAHSTHDRPRKGRPPCAAQARGAGASPRRARSASAAVAEAVGATAWPLNVAFDAWLATHVSQSAAPSPSGHVAQVPAARRAPSEFGRPQSEQWNASAEPPSAQKPVPSIGCTAGNLRK